MTEQPRLFHRRYSAGEWVAAVDGLNKDGALAFIYAEEAADIHLIKYHRPEPTWAHGRAFGPRFEVRWSRRLDGEVDLVLLTESELEIPHDWQPLPLLADAKYPVHAVVEDEWVTLRGVSRRHETSPYGGDVDAPMEWTDSRIPRAIVYPVEAGAGTPPQRWARLRVKIYRANGCPVLTRLVGIKETSYVQPF